MNRRKDEEVAILYERLVTQLGARGMRGTAKRRLVCETFFRKPGHHSIDDVLGMVHKSDPRIGYVTVYRTLRLLVDSGIAAERRFEDAPTRFEVRDPDSHHDHLICVRCGQIAEFEDDELERRQHGIAQVYGFSLVRHKHELYGLCRACQVRETPSA